MDLTSTAISPTPAAAPPPRAPQVQTVTTEPRWLRTTLILLAMGIVGLILILPLALVLIEAFRSGLAAYLSHITDPAARHAIGLSLQVTAIALAVNTVFGVAAAWLITRFRFRGRSFLVTLIDLPFSVSPVIAGLVFVLLFGAQGFFGPWLIEHGYRVIFALPGIVLATLFITFPFVSRELIPLMDAQGIEDEEAARSLGAGGWTTFWRVTIPKIRGALLTGGILCAARAMGEFGAVSVVSGHIRMQTNTLPLHIEVLFNEFEHSATFANASLLAFLAIIALGLKAFVEWRTERRSHVL